VLKKLVIPERSWNLEEIVMMMDILSNVHCSTLVGTTNNSLGCHIFSLMHG
jgi:hypothetical protein